MIACLRDCEKIIWLEQSEQGLGEILKKGYEKVEQCGRLDHAVKWKTLGGFWAKELYNMVYKLKNYNDQCVENNYTSLRYRNRTTN